MEFVFSPVEVFLVAVRGLLIALWLTSVADEDLAVDLVPELTRDLKSVCPPRRLLFSSTWLVAFFSFLLDRRLSPMVSKRIRFEVPHISHGTVIVGSDVMVKSRMLEKVQASQIHLTVCLLLLTILLAGDEDVLGEGPVAPRGRSADANGSLFFDEAGCEDTLSRSFLLRPIATFNLEDGLLPPVGDSFLPANSPEEDCFVLVFVFAFPSDGCCRSSCAYLSRLRLSFSSASNWVLWSFSCS